jgi:hypothetical protein
MKIRSLFLTMSIATILFAFGGSAQLSVIRALCRRRHSRRRCLTRIAGTPWGRCAWRDALGCSWPRP